jgi:diacylglycerol kinase (ATP)
MPLIARRALVVVNRKSLQGDQGLSAGLRALETGGMELTVLDGVAPAAIADVLDEHHPGHDLAILGGGDGTMSAAAATLVVHGLPLAILPLGTANDLARTLGIPPTLQGAVNVILDGELHAIDLGRVNDRLFFNVASVGLGVQVQRFHRGERKRRWKVLSYVLSVLDAFRVTRSFRARITVDGDVHQVRCIHVAVGNGRHYGGGMTVAEDAVIDDGTLDVYLLRPQTLVELLMLAPALRWGRHRASERTMSFRGRHVTIETDRPWSINADGEIVSRTPAELTVVPGALRVVVPRRRSSPDQ